MPYLRAKMGLSLPLRHLLLLYLIGSTSNDFKCTNVGLEVLAYAAASPLYQGTRPTRRIQADTPVLPIPTAGDVCAGQCVHLSGPDVDRCALWHQVVVGLGYSEDPFNVSCPEFVRSVDICSVDPVYTAPVKATCGEDLRIVMLNGTSRPHKGHLLPWPVAQMKHIKAVNLSYMGLSGTLPTEWSGMERLVEVDLRRNDLTGTLPVDWRNISTLTTLYIYRNNLSGTLPEEWIELVNLERLDIWGNSFTGTLPAKWGHFKHLRLMSLTRNQLQGTLPEDWQYLESLTELYVDENYLEGSIPWQYGALTKLTSVNLHRNNLSGTLPAHWGQLQKLINLVLRNNSLSGPLPAQWSNMTSMAALLVGSNQLTSTIPDSWGHLRNLVLFDVSGNPSMTGRFPSRLLFPADNINATRIFEYYGPVIRSTRLLPLFIGGHDTRLVFLNGTPIDLPTRAQLHKACQKHQTSQGALYVITTDDEAFWCGKSENWYIQVAVLWGGFALIMLLMPMFMWSYRRRLQHQEHGKPEEESPRAQHGTVTRALELYRVHLAVPVHVVLSLYDIVSDVLLVVSMYPSWTCYLVLVGLFLPDIICSALLVVQSVPHLQPYSPSRTLSRIIAGGMFPAVVATLPLLLAVAVVRRLFKGGEEAMTLAKVNVEQVILVFSVLTAITEDVFTIVFSTVGMVIMNSNPINTISNRIYFPVWAYWLSVPPSMVHLAIVWWKGLGMLQKYGRDFSWVGRAIRNMYKDQHIAAGEVKSSETSCKEGENGCNTAPGQCEVVVDGTKTLPAPAAPAFEVHAGPPSSTLRENPSGISLSRSEGRVWYRE